MDIREHINSETIILASVSGGKDSTALWLHLKELGLANIMPVFADTGWEHPLTYEYIEYLEKVLGPINKVQSDGFLGMALKKKALPCSKVRFCTQELKLKPIKKFVDSLRTKNILMCSGVRAEESKSRASLDEYSDFDEVFGVPQWRPLHNWTWQQVFEIHKKYDVEPNPLYKQGMMRVGCMPCVMNNLTELGTIAERFPEVFDKVKELEDRVAEVTHRKPKFFRPDFIPERFCSEERVRGNGVVMRVPTTEDVRRYVLMDKGFRRTAPGLVDVEPEELEVCTSRYGLCE